MDDSNPAPAPRPAEMFFADLADQWIMDIFTTQAAADAAAPATTTSADTTAQADQAASQEITQ